MEKHGGVSIVAGRHGGRVCVRCPMTSATSTVFCTQYAKKDWHQRLGSGVHADAIMDRIVHNTLWIETGDVNMREQTAASS